MKNNNLINKIKNLKKKEKIIFISIIITLIILVTTLITTSYAVMMKSQSSEQKDLFATGDMTITFAEEEDSTININPAIPVSDEYGLKKSPYKFTISNSGTYKSSYNIKLIEDDTTTIPLNNVKYSINGSTPKLLSERENQILETGTIAPGNTKAFELRLWINEETTNDISGLVYSGQIQVSGKAEKYKTIAGNTNIVTDGYTGILNGLKIKGNSIQEQPILNNSNFTIRSYYNSSGTLVENNSYYMSDFLEVEPNSTYKLYMYTASAAAQPYAINYFDENQEWISQIAAKVAPYTYDEKTFTVPANVKYIRIHTESRIKNSVLRLVSTSPLPSNPIDIQSVGDEVSNVIDEVILDESLFSSVNVFNTAYSSGYKYAYIEGLKPNTQYNVTVERLNGTKYNSVSATLLISNGTFAVSSGKYTVISHSSDANGSPHTTDANGRLTIGAAISGLTQEELNTIWENTNIKIQSVQTMDKYKIPVIVSSKNLFDINSAILSGGSSSTFTKQDDSSLIIQMSSSAQNVSPGSTNNSSGWFTINYKVIPNKIYTISYDAEFLEKPDNVSFPISHGILNQSGNSFTMISIKELNQKYKNSVHLKSDVDGNLKLVLTCNSSKIRISNIQIEYGTTATDYEPYRTLTTTDIYLYEPLRAINGNYDYIDFQNNKIVRNIAVREFNGTEKFSMFTSNSNNFFRITLSTFKYKPYVSNGTNLYTNGLCNYYPVVSSSKRTNKTFYGDTGAQITYDFGDNDYANVDAFKSYFAGLYANGSPVKIYIVSANPTESSISLPKLPDFDGNINVSLNTEVSASFELNY